MNCTRLVVTTSWDDGHPADSRLADLLAKYGIAGTFYVPTRNSEGRPVMTDREIKHISSKFETGGHSSSHRVMTSMPAHELSHQLSDNKTWLEEITGRPAHGFCYVQGRYNRSLSSMVERAGYKYARTVENFHARLKTNVFEMPTTLQLYPHGRSDYLKNFLRGPYTGGRTKHFLSAISHKNLLERIEQSLTLSQRSGEYFHLWGHSWEIEMLDLWGLLEGFLGTLSSTASIQFATNHDALFHYNSDNVDRVNISSGA